MKSITVRKDEHLKDTYIPINMGKIYGELADRISQLTDIQAIYFPDMTFSQANSLRTAMGHRKIKCKIAVSRQGGFIVFKV